MRQIGQRIMLDEGKNPKHKKSKRKNNKTIGNGKGKIRKGLITVTLIHSDSNYSC